MSNRNKLGMWCISSLIWVSLTACQSSSHLFVDKAELQALDQCLQSQKSQQTLFSQQQTKLEESIDLLSRSLDEQRKLAAMIPPIPAVVEVERPSRVVCPSVLPRPVQTNNANDTAFQDKQIVGEKENVLLNDVGILIPARIDTGTATSSLDARDIQTFERNGEEWVRFTVYHPETREPIPVERKRIRRVHIVQPNADESERRPVIELRLTLGKITQNAEFTLADRSNLENAIVTHQTQIGFFSGRLSNFDIEHQG